MEGGVGTVQRRQQLLHTDKTLDQGLLCSLHTTQGPTQIARTPRNNSAVRMRRLELSARERTLNQWNRVVSGFLLLRTRSTRFEKLWAWAAPEMTGKEQMHEHPTPGRAVIQGDARFRRGFHEHQHSHEPGAGESND